MDECVPTFDRLEDVYPGDAFVSQQGRLGRLHKKCEELWNGKPDFISRSPGRVNLLGEHVDYSLYEVLPMAITDDVLIAVKVQPVLSDGRPSFEIHNVDDSQFDNTGSFSMWSDEEAEHFMKPDHWANYFKAGVQGAMSFMRNRMKFEPCGMTVVVSGSVPPCSGLSSSAAFVCASALAVLRAHGQNSVLKRDLVELAVISERAVGVNSGGMDQAASVFGAAQKALSVTFYPKLDVKYLAFPILDPPITFMIAQSFVVSDKKKTGPERYNLRVVECTLAAELMAKQVCVQLQDDHSPLGHSLRGFQNAFFQSHKTSGTKAEVGLGESKTPYPEQIDTILHMLPKLLTQVEGYSVEEIAKMLYDEPQDTSDMQQKVKYLERRYMTKFPVRATRFQLRNRASHVFNEASRVLKFKALLTEKPTPSDLLKRLGDCMNSTQESCRDVYDCSCPEIEMLCEIAKEAGSYGSRLSGAGWGGCTVHLVPKDRVEAVKRAWEERFYRKKWPDITQERLEEAIVTSEPAQGAAVYVPR